MKKIISWFKRIFHIQNNFKYKEFVLTAEFNPEDKSLDTIADLSKYLSKLDVITITSNIEKFQAGYRLSVVILTDNKNNHDTICYQYLSNVSDWIRSATTLYKYYFVGR